MINLIKKIILLRDVFQYSLYILYIIYNIYCVEKKDSVFQKKIIVL